MGLTFGYMFYKRLTLYFSKEIIVVISWLLVVPAAVGIMYAQTLFWVSFFYIVRTFFAMTPGALWNSFQFEWIQPKHRGKVTGLLSTGQRGLRATGTLVGGFVFGALGAALFPIAMTAYPIAGFLPLIQSKLVKKKIQEKKNNRKKKKD
jgi:predicted MFS family arabinose efflux permease